MQQHPNSELRNLRAWYLARLRKSALLDEQGLQATPSTLIKSDKEHIAKLAAASLVENMNHSNAGILPFALFWLAASGLAFFTTLVVLTAPL